MIQRIIVIIFLSLSIASCGGAAPAATEAPAATDGATESFTGDIYSPTAEPPTQTSTPAPTSTPPAATRTDTPLPPLELPTEAVNAPIRMVWDGTPTYPGDSTPGYSFRVTYDPDLWALTEDQFGYPALGHRDIPFCVISVTSGRGLPPNMTVEHDILKTGNVTFDVGIAFENGARKFVTYTGGDGNIITAFEVSFQEESDVCLEDAVTVLSTLKSVPASQATPAP